jgi:hypothetical protein
MGMVSTNQLEDSMQSFKFNNVDVRFFSIDDDVYFVTSDSNDAFGFAGQNTRLDRLSVQVDTLAKDTDRILSIENLAKNTLVILLSELIKGIIRFNSPELENLSNVFVQMSAKGFMQSFAPIDRPMLPPTSDNDRVQKLAGSVAGRNLGGKGQDLIDLPDWQTVTQMLGDLGESIEDENSLAKNDEFRFWINRNMSDIYRAQFGEEPPTVDRKITKEAKTRAYGYPPSFFGLVKLFLSEWINRRG